MKYYFLTLILIFSTSVFATTSFRQLNALTENEGKIERGKFYTPVEIKKVINCTDRSFIPLGALKGNHPPLSYLLENRYGNQDVYYSNLTSHLFVFYITNSCNTEEIKSNSNTLLDVLKEKKGFIPSSWPLSVYYFSEQRGLSEAQKDLIKTFNDFQIEVSVKDPNISPHNTILTLPRPLLPILPLSENRLNLTASIQEPNKLESVSPSPNTSFSSKMSHYKQFYALEKNEHKIKKGKFYTPSEVKQIIGCKSAQFSPLGLEIESRITSFLVESEYGNQNVYYSNLTSQLFLFYMFNSSDKKEAKPHSKNLLEVLKTKKGFVSSSGVLSAYYFSENSGLIEAQKDLIKTFKKFKIDVSVKGLNVSALDIVFTPPFPFVPLQENRLTMICSIQEPNKVEGVSTYNNASSSSKMSFHQQFKALQKNEHKIKRGKFYVPFEMKNIIDCKEGSFAPLGALKNIHNPLSSFILENEYGNRNVYYSNITPHLFVFHISNSRNKEEKKSNSNTLLDILKTKKGLVSSSGVLSAYYFSEQSELSEAQKDLIKTFNQFDIEVAVKGLNVPTKASSSLKKRSQEKTQPNSEKNKAPLKKLKSFPSKKGKGINKNEKQELSINMNLEEKVINILNEMHEANKND